MSQDSNMSLKNFEKLIGNIPDNVKDIFSSLVKSDFPEKDSKPKDEFHNLEMLMQVKGLMDKFNNQNDVRMELIKALKPFLRPSRQYKITQCLKALKLSYFCKEASFFTMNQGEKEVKGE